MVGDVVRATNLPRHEGGLASFEIMGEASE